MAGSAASFGMATLPFAVLTTGYARYHGLHLARTDAARRAVIEEMVAANRPLNFDVTGTYAIDRGVDLSGFAGRTIDLHPNCRLKSNGAGAAAHVFRSQGGNGIRIRGGILTPGSAVRALLDGHAIYFGDATDCWVEETIVEGAVRGAIIFNGATRCGWRDPVCRHSLQYANPPADHSGLGYDFYLTGGIADFNGQGGLSHEGGGVGFGVQSLSTGGDAYERVSLTGWRVVRALAYGAMLYRNSDAATFRDIVLYGDLVDTVYGSVPAVGSGRRIWGAGVYVQGVEDATAGAKIIRNTNINTDSEQLAPGAIGTTNCTRGTLRADLIENANWYGVTVRDPNGEGNPGNPNAGLGAKAGGRMIVDVGVIRRARLASVEQRDFPVLEVRASIEDPRAQALLVRNPSANQGRSLCERTILNRFDVVGGGNADGRGPKVAAIQVEAGTLEWNAGRIQGYRGLVGVGHHSDGALALGDVSIDGAALSDVALVTTGRDAGVPVAFATGSIKGRILTVTAVLAGHLRAGVIVSGPRLVPGTQIVRILSGNGGAGTYEVSASQTVGPITIAGRLPVEHSRASNASRIIASPGRAVRLSRPLEGLALPR